MKFAFSCCILLLSYSVRSQADLSTQNIFIITTDGFRWQEVFSGADSNLINSEYVGNPELIRALYWDSAKDERRKKLMPFFWNTIARDGQIYGNRYFNNQMDVRNLFKISYPGYNEMLTGYPDPFFIPNVPLKNRNQTILEYLDGQPAFTGKVAAFSSWNIFNAILNKKRNHFPSNCGYETTAGDSTLNSLIVRATQDIVLQKKHTRYDLLTYLTAREYIDNHKPRVVLIGFGETDEFAHRKEYDHYLQQANNIDKMIGELWYYVQTDPYYRNKTTFIITTDHGRGKKSSTWYKHGILTAGSGETWFAVIGPGISPAGEMKAPAQLFQKQIASTIACLLGQTFTSSRNSGTPIPFAETVPKNAVLNYAGVY